MVTGTHAAADFYITRQGAMAGHLVRQRLQALWPSLAGQSVLGLGYAGPYLRLWREQAGRCVALMPAQIGAARWPPGAANLSCTAEEDALPFPDLCFDRILLVHGLEAAENARRMLREVWRVMKDDGRLLVVAPNRRGMWAHVESTPFGQGQPYSPGQIGRLLAAAMFRVERRDTALYMPPTRLRLVVRSARLWERAGRALLPQFAGVTITEATKDLYGVVPVRALPHRRKVLAVNT
ncbi:class I SAM-dependent methyltransferase [Rhodovastum sp. RN2-1]|uniref:Class I SAM-dependent methyltransferase n=2 Tax=Limobrevibacterium gyesilva TaxID=2991712 RepID=A0AA41YXT2_9PROT|nr:class I SAM-dependent methyltransferase [Limobrevibacterium gyesilva]